MMGQTKLTFAPMQRVNSTLDGPPPTSGRQDPQFRDFMRTLQHIRSRLRLVFACAIIGATLAGLLSNFVMRHYTAQALLMVNEVDPNDARRIDDGAMDTHIATLSSQAYIDRAFAAIEKNPELQGLYNRAIDIHRHLIIMQVLHSHLISIDFTAKSPQVAAAVANEIAQLYVDQRASPISEMADAAVLRESQRVEQLKNELRKARTDGAEPEVIAGLNRKLDKLKTALSVAQSQEDSDNQARLLSPPIQIYALAEPPELPSSVRPVLMVIPALFASTLFGVALAALLGRLDRHVRNLTDVRQAFDAPVAGELPPKMLPGRLPWLRPVRSRAYDLAMEELVVDLFLEAGSSATGIVMVTDAGASGASDFALDLAQAAARMKEVLIVVIGDGELSSRYSEVILEWGSEFERVDLMSMADTRPLLLEEAASGVLERKLRELRKTHDLIVLAVPPVVKSPAARIMAGKVDFTIVNVAKDLTTYEDVAAALEELTRPRESWRTFEPREQPVIILSRGVSSGTRPVVTPKTEIADKPKVKEPELNLASGAENEQESQSEEVAEVAGAPGAAETSIAVKGGTA